MTEWRRHEYYQRTPTFTSTEDRPCAELLDTRTATQRKSECCHGIVSDSYQRPFDGIPRCIQTS